MGACGSAKGATAQEQPTQKRRLSRQSQSSPDGSRQITSIDEIGDHSEPVRPAGSKPFLQKASGSSIGSGQRSKPLLQKTSGSSIEASRTNLGDLCEAEEEDAQTEEIVLLDFKVTQSSSKDGSGEARGGVALNSRSRGLEVADQVQHLDSSDLPVDCLRVFAFPSLGAQPVELDGVVQTLSELGLTDGCELRLVSSPPLPMDFGMMHVIKIAGLSAHPQFFELPPSSERLVLQLDGNHLAYDGVCRLQGVVHASAKAIKNIVLSVSDFAETSPAQQAPSYRFGQRFVSSIGRKMLSLLGIVFLSLQALECIDSLCLLHCMLPDDAVSISVAEMIGNMAMKRLQLRELKVCCCKIAGIAAGRCLISPCEVFTNLSHLELSCSVLPDETIASICACEGLKNLSSLYMRWIHPIHLHVSRVRSVQSATLKPMGFMPSGGFGSKSAAALVRLVSECQQLRHLQLVGFGPGQAGAFSLDEDTSNFGDEGAKALATELPLHPSLEKVILTGCNIKEAGALALADAVRVALSMAELDLSWNGPIDKEAANALKVTRQNDITIWLPLVEFQKGNALDGEILKCMEPTYGMLATSGKAALRQRAHGHVSRGRMPYMGQLLYAQDESRERGFQKALELIERGGDPNLCGKFNETLLHYAASTGDPSAVPRLVELGANVNLTSQFEEGVRESETPLETCLRRRKGNWQTVARLLISAGCMIRRSEIFALFEELQKASEEDKQLLELLQLCIESQG